MSSSTASSGPGSYVTTLIIAAILTLFALISPWVLSLVLIIVCGICVAFEFALVQMSMRELERDVQGHIRGAEALVGMKRDTNAMLAASQLGITLSSLGLTLALEPALEHLLSQSGWSEITAASPAIALGAGAFFHVTFGELLPKGIALVIPRKVLYVTAPFMSMFRFLAVPFIKSCNAIANVSVKALTGKDPDTEAHHEANVPVSEALVVANAEGRIGRRQLQIMKNVLNFADRTAREVMTPARDVVTLDTTRAWKDNMKLAEENGFSRFPVTAGNPHDVVGYVRRTEMLKSELDGHRDLERLLRPIDRRPETAPLLLLNLFKGTPLVACYDEHDSFCGLLTAEDVIEQIVGEVYDDTDDLEAPSIEKRADGSVHIDGQLLLEDAGEALNLSDLEEHQDVDTIGGLVLKALARQPVRGDRVDIGDWTAVVESTQGFRILWLTFLPKPKLETPPSDPALPLPPLV